MAFVLQFCGKMGALGGEGAGWEGEGRDLRPLAELIPYSEDARGVLSASLGLRVSLRGTRRRGRPLVIPGSLRRSSDPGSKLCPKTWNPELGANIAVIENSLPWQRGKGFCPNFPDSGNKSSAASGVSRHSDAYINTPNELGRC